MAGNSIVIRARIWKVLWLLLGSFSAAAAPTLNLPIDYEKPTHLRQIPFIVEPTLGVEAEEMSSLFSAPSLAQKMMQVKQDQIRISQFAYWAKIDIHNPTDFQQNITVFLNNPFLDSVQFFRDDGLGLYESGLSGSLVDLPRWSHPDRLPSLPLQIKPKNSTLLLIRVRNTLSTRMMSPIYVASTASYAEFQRKQSTLWALKLGFLLYLGFMGFALAFTDWKPFCMWLSLLALNLGALALVKSGYAREFGWLLRGGTANQVAWVLTVTFLVLYIRFGMDFLRTSMFAPLINRWLHGISLGVACLIPTYAWLWPYLREWAHSIIPAIMILQLPVLLLLLWSCIFAYPLAKHRSIAFFVATLSLIIGGFLDAYGSHRWYALLDRYGFSIFPGAFIALYVMTWVTFYELYLQRKRRRQLSELLQRKEQYLARAFVLGQEAERRRLGQELHDHMAALLLNARLMMPSFKDDQTSWSSKDWEGYQRGLFSLDQSLYEVRALSYHMDPHPMNEPKLKEELARLLKNYNDSRPLCAFHLDFEMEEMGLHSSTVLDLYRICQECLSNIVKHSAATSVYVEFTHNDGRIQLCVTDNGIGFDQAKSRGGIGLKSIRNRLSHMKNHEVRIDSSPGQGTSVYVSFINEQKIRLPTGDDLNQHP